MSPNHEALRDRFLAVGLAAPLRESSKFRTADIHQSFTNTWQSVRMHATNFSNNSSASKREIQLALREAENQYRTMLTGDTDSHRVVQLVRRCARILLQPAGSSMMLRVCPDDPGREILRWRFISLMLPPSVLLTSAAEKGVAAAEFVQLLNPSIAPDFEVAELHVHHAAIMSFEDLWVSLRRRSLIRPNKIVRTLREHQAKCPQLHSGDCTNAWGSENSPRKQIQKATHIAEWGDLIRQAFVARDVLDRHSWHSGITLRDCQSCGDAWRSHLRFFLHGMIKPFASGPTIYPWPNRLWAMERRWRKERDNSASKRFSSDSMETAREDLLNERNCLSRAFHYVEPDGDSVVDEDYERLLVQYLRIKTAMFRLLVHPPGEPGLNNFLSHFRQIKVYTDKVGELRPRSLPQRGLMLGAVEFRVASDAWVNRKREHSKLTTLAQPNYEWAWLIHLKRTPADDNIPLYGSSVRSLEKEADKISRVISQVPSELRNLRGIDLAGVESDQPLWVSAETIKRLRRKSHHVAAHYPRLGLEPFRMTLHLGEDFKLLTSGVRAVAEPFQWKLMERGDRIGHAIAITTDPIAWWKQRLGKTICVSRIERLLDLAFLAVYAPKHSPAEGAWLVKNMHALASAIWGSCDKNNVKDEVIKLWSSFGGPALRKLMHSEIARAYYPYEFWIHRYLWSQSTRVKAAINVPIVITNGSHELALLKKALQKITCEVALWQVCIETNPTSNFVVAGLDAPAAQDFLYTRPTALVPSGKGSLTWTISTDDPITFSTTLADEYAYAWAGMVLRKNQRCDPSYARALLDEAAQTSMRMRFTVPDRRKGHPTRYRKDHEDRD